MSHSIGSWTCQRVQPGGGYHGLGKLIPNDTKGSTPIPHYNRSPSLILGSEMLAAPNSSSSPPSEFHPMACTDHRSGICASFGQRPMNFPGRSSIESWTSLKGWELQQDPVRIVRHRRLSPAVENFRSCGKCRSSDHPISPQTRFGCRCHRCMTVR